MLKESPQWPPPMPREEAVHIACSMFFKHLQSIIKDSVTSKLGRGVMRSLNDEDRATIQIDEDCETQELVVSVNVQLFVRLKVDTIFRGNGEMDFDVDAATVINAINTLPEDMDLQTLADFLTAQFISLRNNYSSQDVRVCDEKHPKGRPLTLDEKETLERNADRQCDKMRELYRTMLERKLVAPKPPEVK